MNITNEVKIQVRKLTNNYIKNGALTKPGVCDVCGMSKDKIDVHHKDYTNPLDVIWLCHKCHMNLHFKKVHLKTRKETSTSFKKGYDPRRNLTGSNQFNYSNCKYTIHKSNWHGREVYCFEPGKEVLKFNSILAASKWAGKDERRIHEALKKDGWCGGMKFTLVQNKAQ